MGKNIDYRILDLGPDETMVEVREDLTGTWAATALQEALEAGAVIGKPILSLNLKASGALNSSTLGKLIISQKSFKERGIYFRIKGCSEGIYNTLLLIRAETILDINPETF